MKTRVITSIVAIIALLGAMWFYDTVYFNLLFAAVTLIAIHEIFNAFKFSKKQLYIYFSFFPVVILVFLSDYQIARNLLLPVCYLFVLFLAICIVLNNQTIEFSKIGGMTFFAACVTFCFFSLVHLKTVLPSAKYGADAIYFVSLILGFAWGGDTFAYFAGRAFGKHKLAPNVSPNKTVEGAIGGIIGSMAIGVLFTFLYTTFFSVSGTTVKGTYYIVIILLGAVASILGIMGDLFASAIKRQCDIKDYGTIFPGHGGILDRFDSVLFIAPLVVIVVRVIFYHFSVVYFH